MSMSWLLSNLIAAFLLPPLNALLLLVIGACFWRRRRRLARLLIGTGGLLLWLLALPVVGGLMQRTLEGEALTPAAVQQAQAIVVLGAGVYPQAPEYGGDSVGEVSLVRLRYAAKLQRESGLPLLVSGGRPDGAGGLSEAEAMRQVLVGEFGVPVRWLESASNNTRENARLSAEQLKAEGISRILLVTHAWHMPRALLSFSGTGVEALPAATQFTRGQPMLLDFLPTSYTASRQAMHEWIGLLWYRLRA
jgi:uncharacterized SAM-binding protein YcdF (DUF218 family)